MNYGPVASALGLLVGLQSVFMLPSLAWSIYYRDGQILEWIASIIVVAAVALALWAAGRRGKGAILQREAVTITGLGWIVAGLTGMIPFLFTGTVSTVVDAYFEAISGFTTTGSTILTDIEAVAPSVLFWRSTTHWLGGIGIIVLFIAILPFFSKARRRLYQTELPGVTAEGLTPRIKQTALAMVKIYLFLSLAECLLLWAGPMNLFDALCHTFGTLATGGFSTKNASIAHYRSVYVEVVIIVFMFLAGCNFTLHYFFARGRLLAHWRDVEFRMYLKLIVFATLGIMVLLWSLHHNRPLSSFVRDAAFTVVSLQTTTGYVTADFDQWPNVCRGILVMLMFIGGCGGSTGGGMKVIRYMVAFRHLFSQIERYHSPHSVRPVKLGNRVLDDQLQFAVLSFFFAVLVIAGVGTVALTVFEPEISLLTAFTAVTATLNNIGPGLDQVGAIENYAFFSATSKWLLSLLMVMGRLELFSILVLLAPRFWREA